MREELLTELHIPSWPCVAKKGPMVVIDRDSKWRAAHRREGVGARRRTPRATRRIKEECEAELCVAEAIPSLCEGGGQGALHRL